MEILLTLYSRVGAASPLVKIDDLPARQEVTSTSVVVKHSLVCLLQPVFQERTHSSMQSLRQSLETKPLIVGG
jgi:hypothetical protein